MQPVGSGAAVSTAVASSHSLFFSNARSGAPVGIGVKAIPPKHLALPTSIKKRREHVISEDYKGDDGLITTLCVGYLQLWE